VFARPGLPGFRYVRALTPDEAVGFLREHGQAARLMMGGTDLLPGMRNGLIRPEVVVDVKHLPGMCDIVYDEQVGLTVGAGVTMNGLVCHPEVQARYPLLAEAAESVASYQIRNRATIGGNLCNASPCADTAPTALALEAEFVLYGPDGARTVPAGEFFLGPGKTVLRADELLSAVRFPPLPTRTAAHYLKLGRCRSGDLSLVSAAVLGFSDGTGSGYRFRVGLGSVAPTPIRAREAEAFLAANPPGEDAFSRAAELAMAAASPITDVRGTAEYQRAMVRTLVLRALRDVHSRLAKRGE
jgi:CO/xanthine dehydrogenase FAD-binding subunit